MKAVATLLTASVLSLGTMVVHAQNDEANEPGQIHEGVIIIQTAPMEGEDRQMNSDDQATDSQDQAPATAENCPNCDPEDGLGAPDEDQQDDQMNDSDDDDGNGDNS